MKLARMVGLLASVLLCASAAAQQIGWKPVSPGMPTFGQQQGNGSISFAPIGPTTHGSDGSRSTQSGNTTINSDGTSSYRTGNITTHSDGSHSMVVGDTAYVQRADGSQYSCRMVSGQAVCKPR